MILVVFRYLVVLILLSPVTCLVMVGSRPGRFDDRSIRFLFQKVGFGFAKSVPIFKFG